MMVVMVMVPTWMEGMLTAWARLLALRGREKEKGSPFSFSSFMVVNLWIVKIKWCNRDGG